jgi:hypothetical protein
VKGFDDATLGWRGEEYTVPADQQLMLIARVEDALEMGGNERALHVLLRPGGPSHTRLARAFGAALRYAGAQVTDDEVYLSIQSDLADGRTDAAGAAQAAILSLLAIISPPVAMKLAGAAEGKPSPEAT